MASIDHLVALSKWTLFNPVLSLAWLVHDLVILPPSLGRGNYHPILVVPSFVLLGWLLTWSSSYWTNRPRLARIQASQWKDEVVVLTGGAAGIGARITLELAGRGAKVVTLDRAKADYASLSTRHTEVELAEITRNIHPYICDITSADALNKVLQSIKALHGDPTILINNAGITNSQPLTDLTQAEVTELLNVNLVAPLWLIQSLLPGMLAAANSGKACHIVSISSIMGHIGVSKMVDYCASKHGIVGLHRALRYELSSHHRASARVRTTLVILGHVRTRLFEGIYFNPIARSLAPSMEPQYVARRIVQAVERRQTGTLAMPWYANWTEGIDLLPSWAADAVQWVSGADRSFDAVKKAV